MKSAQTRDDGEKRLRPDPGWQADEGVSLFALGNTMLRHRWRIGRWMLLGAVVAALLVFTKPRHYTASGSFIPQSVDQGKSSLASLAGQLGVSLASSGVGLSPEFYVKVLKSRELLRKIAHDTLAVPERGGTRVTFFDLFDVGGRTPALREEQGIRELNRMITASSVRTTGLVEFSVATPYPSVSLEIANELITGVNDFNQRMRQEQASAERKFVESRLAVASSDLRASEDRLQEFLGTNRQFASPDLTFQRDRLQRDLSLKQQVFTSLTQSYEDVRLREVRDTPVITLVEAPVMPTIPDPSGRVWSLLLGILFGGFIGVVSAFASEKMARDTGTGDPAAREFAGTLSEIKGGMLGRVRGLRAKMGR